MQLDNSNTELEFMRQSEAREWKARFDKKAKECGRNEAIAWWRDTIKEIEKKRGKTEANALVERITQLRTRRI